MLVSNTLFINDKTLVFAKITGVQNSNIRASSKVLRIISLPIPFKSPIEIPTIIFSDFFTIIYAYLSLILQANLEKIIRICLQELSKLSESSLIKKKSKTTYILRLLQKSLMS